MGLAFWLFPGFREQLSGCSLDWCVPLGLTDVTNSFFIWVQMGSKWSQVLVMCNSCLPGEPHQHVLLSLPIYNSC